MIQSVFQVPLRPDIFLAGGLGFVDFIAPIRCFIQWATFSITTGAVAANRFWGLRVVTTGTLEGARFPTVIAQVASTTRVHQFIRSFETGSSYSTVWVHPFGDVLLERDWALRLFNVAGGSADEVVTLYTVCYLAV